MAAKTAMIALVGRPNVGKSTLTNALVGEKVAIVTDKPQTTRSRIVGVVTRGETQLVLLDTPGFHKAQTRLGDYMVRVVRESVADVDAVVLVVEPTDRVGTQEELLLERIRASGAPAVLAVNKIDTVPREKLLPVIAAYAGSYDFAAVVPLSARTGEGTDLLLEELEKFAQEGEFLFPEDEYTNQTLRQMSSELIREKLLQCLDKEIPHGTAVEITAYRRREDGVTEIEAVIYCEKASHKGIIIGKNGAMLKKIGSRARPELEELAGGPVYLQTWVRVKENWRDSDVLVRNMGYRDDE